MSRFEAALADREVFRRSSTPMWELDIAGLLPWLDSLPAAATQDQRAFLDAHPELVAAASRSVVMLDANEAALRLYEAESREQLLSRRDAPAVREVCAATMLALAGGRTQVRCRTTSRTLRGRELSLLITSSIPARDDPVRHALVCATDVTEWRDVEDALHESETRLSTIIDFLPDATFAINREGVVIAWNRAIEDMSGVAARDMLGKGDYEYSLPFYQARRPILIDLVLTPDKDAESTYTLARKSENGILIADTRVPRLKGRERMLWGKASVLWDSRERVTGAIESVRDITDRHNAQEALRVSEEKYRTVVENAMEAIFVAQDGVMKFANPSATRIIGRSARELSLRPFTEIVHPEDRALVVGNYTRRLRQAGAGASSYRFRLVDVRGEARLVEITAIRVEWENKPASLCFLADITESKRTEEELRNLQKLDSLGTLAGGIAHDFNNQLTGIIGNVSLAMEGIQEGSERLQLLREALDACLVARSLTKQLMTFTSGGNPATEVVDLGTILRAQAVFFTRGTVVRCVTTDITAALMARVDPQQIAQVVQNLVLNAVQAMPDGGTLRVGGSVVEMGEGQDPLLPAGRYVKATFKDEGSGISADHIGRVFDPFFSTKAKGHGLGLAMCHSIIKKHNGRIFAESAPGTGAVFTILLPAASEPAVPESLAPPAVTKESGRILILDDEPSVAKVLTRMLLKLGYQSTTVSDGAEAVAEYERARETADAYTLAILDMTIPGGMGGRETMEELRRMDPCVRAIASSGYSASSDYLSYGFSGVLHKPYVLSDLLSVIRDVMQRGA